MYRNVFQRIVDDTLDFIFPPTCVHCERVGALLCQPCIAQTPRLSTPPQFDDLDGFATFAPHQDAIRDALHGLKYEGLRAIAPLLARLLAPHIQWTIDTIIPVPLHYARLHERGYNQANELAQALAYELNVSAHDDILIRHRETRTQVGLDANQRRSNVDGAFVVKGDVIPERVLLVDDVCTTGSTLKAAAQALYDAGAKNVYAATISLAV